MKHEVNDLEVSRRSAGCGQVAGPVALRQMPGCECAGLTLLTKPFSLPRRELKMSKKRSVQPSSTQRRGRECPFFKVASLFTLHRD